MNSAILNFIKEVQRKDCLEYKIFDEKYKVDTAAPTKTIIENEVEVVLPYYEENSSYFEGSTHYQPTANYWIDLINQYFKDKISGYKFIDIGCGKGKPIIYNIVNSVGYKEYIGIEIDPVLSEIFKKNLISVNSSNAKSLNIDAFDYDYSENKCIYFFAKPFEKPIFDLFIEKIINDIIKVDCYLVFVFEQDLAPLDHKNLELIYSNEPITIYKPKEYV
jgi:SAM-dependent methyltransferase